MRKFGVRIAHVGGRMVSYRVLHPDTPDLLVGLPTRIFLTGFMGSGKSTVGAIVANVLGFDFLDLDDAIAERAGLPVPQLFAERGEAAFRTLEAECLRATARREELVVALGGGALAREDNLQWALEHGLVVYLRVPLRHLVARLRRSRTRRPLLLDADGRMLSPSKLRAKIEGMLRRREPFYGRAHLVIDVGERERVGLTVDRVVKAVRRYDGDR